MCIVVGARGGGAQSPVSFGDRAGVDLDEDLVVADARWRDLFDAENCGEP